MQNMFYLHAHGTSASCLYSPILYSIVLTTIYVAKLPASQRLSPESSVLKQTKFEFTNYGYLKSPTKQLKKNELFQPIKLSQFHKYITILSLHIKL